MLGARVTLVLKHLPSTDRMLEDEDGSKRSNNAGRS